MLYIINWPPLSWGSMRLQGRRLFAVSFRKSNHPQFLRRGQAEEEEKKERETRRSD